MNKTLKEIKKIEIEKVFEKHYKNNDKFKALEKTAKELGICINTIYNFKNGKPKQKN
jgi:hypothetical protein